MPIKKQNSRYQHKSYEQEELELAALKKDYFVLRQADCDLVQYGQCRLELGQQQDKAQSIVVCAAISEVFGLVHYSVVEKRAMNGEDLVGFLLQLRARMGMSRTIVAFGDNSSINRSNAVKGCCQQMDITQLFNVTYRPDLLGINKLWDQVRESHQRT